MKQRHPHNIQTRLSADHTAFLATLDAKPAEAIRRAIDLARLSVEASRAADPAAQLAYHLDRAAAIVATMRSHPAPPILAGSTAAPGQPSVVATGAQVQGAPVLTAPAPAELTGFEGWDE